MANGTKAQRGRPEPKNQSPDQKPELERPERKYPKVRMYAPVASGGSNWYPNSLRTVACSASHATWSGRHVGAVAMIGFHGGGIEYVQPSQMHAVRMIVGSLDPYLGQSADREDLARAHILEQVAHSEVGVALRAPGRGWLQDR